MASMDSTNTSKKITNATQNEKKSTTQKSDSNTEAPSTNNAKWIRSKINMRSCIHFVSSKEDKKVCYCGYEKECHKKNEKNTSNSDRSITTSKWDILTHTTTAATNAFGEIKFDGRAGYIKPKFVRVDIKTEMSVMLEMIKREGKENPKLLISVAGDTNDFKMKAKLHNGLIKAAHSIGAWIITNGTQRQMVAHNEPEQGITLENQKSIVVVGIAPWGVIHNKKTLESKKGLWPVTYKITDNFNDKERLLDPNHSHYILVDDGTQHKLDIEIPFRERLEQEIAKMKTNTGYDTLTIILVLGGGQSALKTVEKALKQDKPAVVVKGSGGAADILAYAFQHVATGDEVDRDNNGQDSNRTEIHLTERLESKINDKMVSNKIDCSIDIIKSCLLKFDLIHIFDFNSDGYDIDAVLLRALLRAYKNRVENQIATDKTNMLFALDYMMQHALQFDKADFVKLLLENDVNLEKFLTVERLRELYKNVFSKNIFKDFGLKENKKEIWLNDVRRLVHDLVGGNYLQHYIHDKNAKGGQKKDEDGTKVQSTESNETRKQDPASNDVQRVDQKRTLTQETNQEENSVKEKKENGKIGITIENPCLDLLIWSVLNNQQDKAKLFWRNVQDKIAAALVAHALFSAMSRQTDDRDLREAIDNNSSEFMTLAIKVAKACYKANEKKTQQLLTRKLKQWGDTTCIEIAVNAHNKGFISLQVCRDLFDNIWMGGLKRQNSTMKLLLYISIPLLIPRFARFEKDDDDQQNSSTDANKKHGLETLCCLSSKRRKVGTENKAKANDKSDQTENCSRGKASGNSCDATESKGTNAYWKLTTFYRAPIIIFMHNIISFVAFLLLYSYVLVSTLKPQMSASEICLILWVFSFFAGEIIQITRIQALSNWKKFKLYNADRWNGLDMFTILLFTIGMGVFMSNCHPLAVESGRVILAIDLVLFFMRILHAFHAHRQLGPKLVMIMNMVWDLGSLAAIIGVFILAYAIASYAILYPNTALSIDTLMKILKRPYWNIYGELGLEEIEGDANCSDNEALYGNGAVPRCPTTAGQYVVPVMMGIYMLMTNILLLSLLIATFSYSIEKVQQHTDLHCSLHRYNLICEYCTKPCLPHPFALLIYLPQIMFLIFDKLRGCMSCGICQSKCCECESEKQRENAFKQSFDKDVDSELCDFEEAHAVQVYQRMEKTRQESIHVRSTKKDKRLDHLLMTMKKLNDVVTAKKPKQYKPDPMQKILTGATKLETKVTSMEQQLQLMSQQLQSVIDALKEHKFETKQTYQEVTDQS